MDMTTDGQLAYVVGSFGQTLTVTDPEGNELLLGGSGDKNGFVAKFRLEDLTP